MLFDQPQYCPLLIIRALPFQISYLLGLYKLESTRFHGHLSDFATKSFTAEADLQANTQNKRHKTLDK